MISENGIIYCATGSNAFLQEAYLSVKSIKQVDSDINISIFVDEGNLENVEKGLFDSVHLIEKPEFGFGDKIHSMRNSPYFKTLYLDCDTFITTHFNEVFSMLNDYDVGVINVPFKNDNYPHFNAGIIAFKKSDKTMYFLEQWDKKWNRKDIDQGIFQSLLNLVSYFVLPSEYNFRLPFVSFAIDKIKIIHSHELLKLQAKERAWIVTYINRFQTERLWFPERGIVDLKSYKNPITRILNLVEGFIYDKMVVNYSKNFKVFEKIRKKILKFELRWFLDWILPCYYREKMKLANNSIKKYL